MKKIVGDLVNIIVTLTNQGSYDEMAETSE